MKRIALLVLILALPAGCGSDSKEAERETSTAGNSEELLRWPEDLGYPRDREADLENCSRQTKSLAGDDAGRKFMLTLQCMNNLGWQVSRPD